MKKNTRESRCAKKTWLKVLLADIHDRKKKKLSNVSVSRSKD